MGRDAALCKGIGAPLSDAFLRRLMASLRAQPDPRPHLHSIWRSIYERFYTDIELAAHLDEVAGLRETLSDLEDRQFGLEAGWRNPQETYSLWKEAAVASAAALGRRVPNPNQEPIPEWPGDAKMLADIERAAGIPLALKRAFGLQGIRWRGGLVPVRLLQAVSVYAALRRFLPAVPKRILEVGAGLGFLEVVLLRAGIFGGIHTVDLPIPTMLQASLLALECGEEAIRLPGEEPRAGVRVVLHGLAWPEGGCDAVINVDSLPEFPRAEGAQVMAGIANTLFRGGVLISVNHESLQAGQTPVRELAATQPTLTPLVRAPAWGRPGYLLEVWRQDA